MSAIDNVGFVSFGSDELPRAEDGSATETAVRRAGHELERQITALRQSATEVEA